MAVRSHEPEPAGFYSFSMPDRSPWKPLRIAGVGLGVAALAFTVWGLLGWGPRAANEQAIGEISRWCERVGGGFLREPVNTLGNLAFVVAGLAMFVVLARDVETSRPISNRFIGLNPISILYASAALFLGPGSMAMHGSHTFFGAWLDNVSMVVYITVPWLVNVAALARWHDRRLFAAYAWIVGLFAAGYWFLGPELGIGLDLFGVSIGWWIISEVLYRWHSQTMRALSGLVGFAVAAVFGITPLEILGDLGSYWWVVLFWLPGLLATGPPPGRRRYIPWFWLGIASFEVAYAIWLTGTNEHSWCSPDSLVQAHAIWHILTAAATWCFFRYFRTEVPAPESGQEHAVPGRPRRSSAGGE